MKHHLTDEQLGATRDGALSGAGAVAADRHLAECAECRQRLHAIAALDAELAGALEHDPGEEYFASFAERVGARIAGGTPAQGEAAAAPRRGFAAWWSSPRRVAWAGGALGLVAVAALVAMLARDHGPGELVARAPLSRELGANAAAPQAQPRADGSAKSRAGVDARARLRTMAPAPRPEPLASASPAPSAPRTFAAVPAPAATGSADERSGGNEQRDPRARDQAAAPSRTQAEIAPTQHAEEVRTLPSGEQEVVTRLPQFTPPPAPALKLPGGLSKPAPGPLGGQPLARQSLAGAAQATGSLERKSAPAHPAPPEPAADAVSGGGRISQDTGGSDMVSAVMVCGKVHDTRGRPSSGALVTVAESGGIFTVGADGAFCADIPESGGTVSVLAVGYRAARVSLTAANVGTPVDITLSAVDVLTPTAKAERGLTYSYMGEPARKAAAAPSLARRAATDASATALRVATADAWTAAAERWELVGQLESPGGSEETGFRVAEARVNAWLVGRADPKRVTGLREAAHKATQGFLDHATDTTSIGIALGWYRVLQR